MLLELEPELLLELAPPELLPALALLPPIPPAPPAPTLLLAAPPEPAPLLTPPPDPALLLDIDVDVEIDVEPPPPPPPPPEPLEQPASNAARAKKVVKQRRSIRFLLLIAGS